MKHCTIADLGIKLTGDVDDVEAMRSTLDEYFSAFVSPQVIDGDASHVVCVECGERLGGLFGTFRWGMGWGEGLCDKCGWPARAYHVPKDCNGANIFDRPLQVILQYYPPRHRIVIESEDDDAPAVLHIKAK